LPLPSSPLEEGLVHEISEKIELTNHPTQKIARVAHPLKKNPPIKRGMASSARFLSSGDILNKQNIRKHTYTEKNTYLANINKSESITLLFV